MYSTTITDFLRKPKPVLKKVSSEDVVLRRRGKDSVFLTAPERASNASGSADLAGYLLANLLEVAGERQSMAHHLAELLKKRFPWMKFLPATAREEFTREFIETLHACASIGKTARLEEVVYSWRSTALIHADPKLAAELKRPLAKSEARPIPRP